MLTLQLPDLNEIGELEFKKVLKLKKKKRWNYFSSEFTLSKPYKP